MGNQFDLSTLAGGAVAERFVIEMQKVLDNIMDPNTSVKKKRKLQLTFTFDCNEDRDISNVAIETKTTLAPAASIGTKILMDRDGKGNAVGAEFRQGRLFDEEPKQTGRDAGNVAYINK